MNILESPSLTTSMIAKSQPNTAVGTPKKPNESEVKFLITVKDQLKNLAQQLIIERKKQK